MSPFNRNATSLKKSTLNFTTEEFICTCLKQPRPRNLKKLYRKVFELYVWIRVMVWYKHWCQWLLWLCSQQHYVMCNTLFNNKYAYIRTCILHTVFDIFNYYLYYKCQCIFSQIKNLQLICSKVLLIVGLVTLWAGLFVFI